MSKKREELYIIVVIIFLFIGYIVYFGESLLLTAIGFSFF